MEIIKDQSETKDDQSDAKCNLSNKTDPLPKFDDTDSLITTSSNNTNATSLKNNNNTHESSYKTPHKIQKKTKSTQYEKNQQPMIYSKVSSKKMNKCNLSKINNRSSSQLNIETLKNQQKNKNFVQNKNNNIVFGENDIDKNRDIISDAETQQKYYIINKTNTNNICNNFNINNYYLFNNDNNTNNSNNIQSNFCRSTKNVNFLDNNNNMDNQLYSGYYSEFESRNKLLKEKTVDFNIEELLMSEEKLISIFQSLNQRMPCYDECFELFRFYTDTSLHTKIEKYIGKKQYLSRVKNAIKFQFFSVMLCYDFSFNEMFFAKYNSYMQNIIKICHEIIILIFKYFSNRIVENSYNIWIQKLELLIKSYDPVLKNPEQIFKEINNYCSDLSDIFPLLLQSYPGKPLIIIYNKLENMTSEGLLEVYRERIYKNINQNGSILVTSSYFQNHKMNENNIPIPYLKNNLSKPYTLVLDLDETLIHFKVNPNKETSGVLQLRPYIYEFLDSVKQYYELVVFTAATQDYADPLIDAIEEKKKYFDYRLYRIHTTIINNDFVKDLSKLGRNLSKVIIVDNMPQNYQLQPNNGINIRPFWGKDQNDMALKDLIDILLNIARKKMNVVNGLRLYKEDIVRKITSNMFRREQMQ